MKAQQTSFGRWTRRFTAGAAVGAILGLLAAPQRGRETRRRLEETTRGVRGGLARGLAWAQERLASVDAEELRARQEQLSREAQQAGRRLRERVRDADDLIREAQAASEQLRERGRQAGELLRLRAEEAQTRLDRLAEEGARRARPRRRRSPLSGGLMLGALVGAAVGLLFAPKPGAETRRQLAARADDLRQRAEPALEKASGALREAAEASSPALQTAGRTLRSGAEQARERSRPAVERVGQAVRERLSDGAADTETAA